MVNQLVVQSIQLLKKKEIDEAPVKKKVLVVGGGPAGMEAAYVAKNDGHEVVFM